MKNLKEIKELGINKGNLNHYLIEGDNIDSLNILKRKGLKVDVVYIDPPYNTKSKTFAYKDSMTRKDWLQFMKDRLLLAKDIMNDNSLFFISIDDREHTYLKALCDEIFGEENFLYNFCVKMKDGGVSGSQITNSHEYTLTYRKGCNRLNERACLIEIDLADWNKNNKVAYFGLTKDDYSNMRPLESNEKGVFNVSIGNINLIEKLGRELSKSHLKKYKYIFRFPNPQSTRSQRIIKELEEDQFISWQVDSRKNKGSKTTYFGKHNGASSPLIFDNEGYILQKMSTIWTDISTAGLANEGGVSFKNGKKPIKLIKRLVDLHPNKKAIVLDFFVGSGTTGQAVMELNKKDGGSRRFILCDINEDDICRNITRERIKNVITEDNLRYYEIK